MYGTRLAKSIIGYSSSWRNMAERVSANRGSATIRHRPNTLVASITYGLDNPQPSGIIQKERGTRWGTVPQDPGDAAWQFTN